MTHDEDMEQAIEYCKRTKEGKSLVKHKLADEELVVADDELADEAHGH